jgi:hypothetical protein
MVQSELITQRFDVVALMTTDEARAAVESINQHMNSARAILLDLYERRGWAALGYTSWRECAVAEFDQAQRTLYQELQAAQIEQRIAPMAQIGTIPERQLRPLAALTPMEQPVAWQEANERANGKPTARVVEQVVTEYLEQKAEAMPPRASKFNDGMKSSDSPEWYTPGHIIDRVVAVFETIDLDPCSSAAAQRTVEARHYYTEADDGLAQPWHGNVYMNPPYGDAIVPWIERMITAYTSGEINAAIALLPGRTETDWFAPLFAYPICFVHGRLKFSESKMSAPFPSVIVYLGSDTRSFYDWFHDIGPIMVPIQATA